MSKNDVCYGKIIRDGKPYFLKFAELRHFAIFHTYFGVQPVQASDISPRTAKTLQLVPPLRLYHYQEMDDPENPFREALALHRDSERGREAVKRGLGYEIDDIVFHAPKGRAQGRRLVFPSVPAWSTAQLNEARVNFKKRLQKSLEERKRIDRFYEGMDA